MHVNTDELATLLQIQTIDLEARQCAHDLEALPERRIILQARAKKKQIEEKNVEIRKFFEESDKRCRMISEEDSGLAEKQRRLQAEIDEVKGDYRSVEARTKDLNGIAKRRSSLDEQLSAALDELARIEDMQKQISLMLEAINKKEAEATTVFIQQGGELKARMSACETKKEQLAENVSEELMQEYEKIRSRTQGVALAMLSENSCGACRAAIDAGRLADLRKQGNVAHCPHCQRLLILQA